MRIRREGPPGGVHVIGPPAYRVSLGKPLLLEAVLVRHPKLRVYVMHYGSPFVDEMIAMLFSHPNLYVDIACNDWGFPRKQFYEHLRKMVDAGFEKRIMFGSDQMVWPATIGKAIETVEMAPFLSKSQKKDKMTTVKTQKRRKTLVVPRLLRNARRADQTLRSFVTG